MEFLVSGVAQVITDPVLREQAERIAASPVVTDGYVFFEFLLGRVLLVEYDADGNPLVHRWREVESQ